MRRGFALVLLGFSACETFAEEGARPEHPDAGADAPAAADGASGDDAAPPGAGFSPVQCTGETLELACTRFESGDHWPADWVVMAHGTPLPTFAARASPG